MKIQSSNMKIPPPTMADSSTLLTNTHLYSNPNIRGKSRTLNRYLPTFNVRKPPGLLLAVFLGILCVSSSLSGLALA